MTDYIRFEELSRLSKEELHVDNGIGTLSEKYLHIFLKNYFEPDESCHEVKIGRFTADILSGEEIIEIQTRSLHTLKEKLEFYLTEGYNVTVVHPVARVRKMISFDPATGETVSVRNHPHTGNFYDAIPEVYSIKPFLDREGFKLRLMLLDVEEYREIKSRPGAKVRRTRRYDRIPFAVGGNVLLDNPADYLLFLPDGLPDEFTSRDFAQRARINTQLTRITLNVLTHLHVTEQTSRSGRSLVYSVNKYFKDFG